MKRIKKKTMIGAMCLLTFLVVGITIVRRLKKKHHTQFM